MKSILALGLLLAFAPMTISSAAAFDGDTPSDDPPSATDCWNNFQRDIKWCASEFPDDDILRKACGEGALIAYRDCLADD